MKRGKFLAGVFFCMLLGCLMIVSCNDDDDDKKIVDQLTGVMASDEGLRKQTEDALAQVDAANYWYGKSLDDMYDFFEKWLVFQPTPENVRQYMDAFYEFTSTEAGHLAVTDQKFINWLAKFMNARGDFMDSPDSIPAVTAWMEDPEIDMRDFVVPEDGFNSFNDFFTRRLMPGVRPIIAQNDPSILTSPADSTLIGLEDYLTPESELAVKGDKLNVDALLNKNALADKFMGGTAVLCMLDTTDYHRFHAPVTGTIISEEQLAGLYYGMTGGWVDYFFEHRRGYFIFETEDYGSVGMVCVGMFSISSVVFDYDEGAEVTKGDELGHFAYGGSAIILLFEPDRVEITQMIDIRPVHVLMGEAIGNVVR